jgi:2'-5' RNA ligase
MRTFIAIDLDPVIKRNLTDFLGRLKKLGPKNISWVREEGMHLTLKFLGEIEESQASPISKILCSVSKKCPRFSLSVRGTGYFPANPKYLRVLWVGVEEQPVLMGLQNELESELEKLSFAREKRTFHPHLTLGRVRAPSNLNEVLEELEKNKITVFGTMTVQKITFFQSRLKPSGAEYTALAECELS